MMRWPVEREYLFNAIHTIRPKWLEEVLADARNHCVDKKLGEAKNTIRIDNDLQQMLCDRTLAFVSLYFFVHT